MRSNEHCPRMAPKHAVPLIKQIVLAILASVEAPVRMRSKLFVALIIGKDRKKECLGIADMHHHRNAELSGPREDRLQPLVIHAHQLSTRIAHREAKTF